jgi:hypothetical protein
MLSRYLTLRLILLLVTCVLKLMTRAAALYDAFVDRRSFGQRAVSALLTTTATTTKTDPSSATGISFKENGVLNDLQRRMEAMILEKPKLVPSALASSGIDNLFYPDFMSGTWDVTQRLIGVQAPLGVEFLNPDPATAERSLAEARAKLHQPVALRLRYVPTRWGVAEDRTFNAASRLDAFAGRTVVAAVQYADVGSSNRNAVLRQGGTADDPLTTVFVRYKGPAAQKIFVTTHSSLSCDGSCVGESGEATDESSPALSQSPCSSCWVASESQRSIFALTNENPAPPIFTDSEVLYEFRRVESQPDTVRGRLRIASYLNPLDPLYFDARDRAVSVQDYTLEMRRAASVA